MCKTWDEQMKIHNLGFDYYRITTGNVITYKGNELGKFKCGEFVKTAKKHYIKIVRKNKWSKI